MALPKGKTVTLTGIVIPADWNDRQEVVAAALATADEKEYRIARRKREKSCWMRSSARSRRPASWSGMKKAGM